MKSFATKFFLSYILLSASIYTLTSCTQNPEVKDNDAKSKQALVGVWRGEGGYENVEDAGWSEVWKITREENGKYTVDYLILNNDEKLYELSSDQGTWSYKDGVYYEVNGNGDQVVYNVYSVKNDWFEYNIAEREGTSNIQETKTVDTFQLQEPPKDYSLVTYDQPSEQSTAENTDEAVVE